MTDHSEVKRLRDWQRQVAEALGISEGPGHETLGFVVPDADEAAQYAREAATNARYLSDYEAELGQLRAKVYAVMRLRQGRKFIPYSIRDLGAGYVAADVDEHLRALDAVLGATDD